MSTPITPLGWKIIEKLAERKQTRQEFCEQFQVPIYRLSNLITGIRPAMKYRKIVMKALDIDESDLTFD